MARFYATIEGNRGMASRMGTANSGMRGHIRGWHVGARVVMGVDDDGQDVCYVYKTGGSSGHKSDVLIGKFKAEG